MTDRRLWFPAKTHGWGWGPPIAWQGWVVLIAYVALVAAGAFVFPPGRSLGSYLLYVGALSAGLTVVCWKTGEPPRWRRGDSPADDD